MRTGNLTFMLAALAAAICTPASVSRSADKKVFSHKAHIEEGADCDTCHKTDKSAPLPQLVKDACEDCHDDGAPAWKLPARSRRLHIRFPHAAHTDSLECNDCHKATIEETQPAGRPLLTRAQCDACHRENDVEVSSARCKACHGDDRRRQPPADHAAGWLEKHGSESRWRVFGRHGKDCRLCHRADACTTCHKTSKPRSHTGLWRTRTHGISAEFDRDSCKTCHNAGACIRCHRTTAPLNHKGAWRATHGLAAEGRSNEHCAVCHTPAWCASCHAGGR